MSTALGGLSYSETITVGWNATVNITGQDYANSPIGNVTTISKQIKMSNGVADAVAGGASELYSAISVITPSSSVSLDVTSLTDILNRSASNLARVKGITVRLLSTTDDATNGTAAASVTVDGTVANALLSTTNSGWLSNNTSKFDIANGDYLKWGTTGAAGIVVSATNKVIKITNNDGSKNAAAQVTIVGGVV